MANGKPPREIDDTERARNMPEAEATALSTIAMTMFLSVLAEAEAARRQELNTPQAGEAASQAAPPPPKAAQAITAGPSTTSSPSQPEQQQADGTTTETPPAHQEFASFADASQLTEVSRPQTDASATASVWQSTDQAATTSGFVPDLHVSNQIDSAGWTGLTAGPTAAAGHDPAGPAPSLSLAGGLHDIAGRLTTTISEISGDLQHQLASATSGLSNLTTAIASDLSHLNTTISETVASVTQNVTQVAAAVPATVAEVLVSGVFGSAPQSPAPDTSDHNGPMFDIGGIVPVSFDHAPLHLGFLGQPHVEGHDTQHDGAFSALGVH
jgi:hypothetical protein